MTNIFVHALEGMPDDPIGFTGKSERDIRVRWLVGEPVGSGPWRVDTTRTTSNGLVLVRQGGKPKPECIDEVHLPFIPNGNELKVKLLSGEIHFAPTLTDPSAIAPLKINPDIVVKKTGGISIFFLAFRKGVDVKLRGAIARAINRHKLAELGKEAASLATGLIPPPMIGHDWGMVEPPSTPISEPGSLVLLCPPKNTFARSLAEEVRNQVNSATRIIVQLPDPSSNWKVMNEEWKGGKGDLLIASWHQRDDHSDDPANYLRAIFHSKGSANWGRYDTVDAHLDKGHHKDAVDQIKADIPVLPLVYWHRHSAYRSAVQNLDLLPGALPADRLVNVIV